MIRILMLFAVIGATYPDGFAQRVLYSSQDLNRRYTEQTISNVLPNSIFSSNITVVYKDGRRETIPRQTIWGYEDRKNRLYRYYEGSFLQVVEIGELIKYSHQGIIGNGILTETAYFSKTLDSDIRRTKHRAEKDVAALY